MIGWLSILGILWTYLCLMLHSLFANNLSIEECVHRGTHRPYFTQRAAQNAQVVDLD